MGVAGHGGSFLLVKVRTFEAPGDSRHVGPCLCRTGPGNKVTRVEIPTPSPSLSLRSVGIGFHCLNQQWTMAEPDESFFQIHTCLFASLREATSPPHPNPALQPILWTDAGYWTPDSYSVDDKEVGRAIKEPAAS